jgi:LEA14-like dessication related protein
MSSMTARSKLTFRPATALAVALTLAACATVKPPTLRVEGLKNTRLGVTGARVDVIFGVRNPNPEDLTVDKVEFELRLNGENVGRGYVSEPFTIRGFAEERVVSSVNVNYLRVPGAVQAVLDDKDVRAQARGTFFIRKGSGFKKLDFDSEAKVQLDRN